MLPPLPGAQGHTPIHRWWVCPKWDVDKDLEGRKLARIGAAAEWQPRCLWECGLLPPPAPADCPRAPPSEGDCGKPKQKRFAGTYLTYTDASAMRPKDPHLRTAACAFWAGDHPADPAAWTLPGPKQTVYRAELMFAILVALRIFRGYLEIASVCKRAVDETERIRIGGAVNPITKHADLWVRYRDALSAEGIRGARVRWVPSHEKEGSDRISPI